MKKSLFLKVLCVVFVFSMIVTSMSIGKITTYADEKEIKVGYDLNSKFIEYRDGDFWGYGVEYLNKIAEYTDWKYEYVKDESWQQSLEKLRNGEIDLICTAHYTEERAEEFVYADIPLGYEATLLYTTTENDISYQDYEAMQGSKVGLLTESYSAKECLEYMQLHEISGETIYFETEYEMLMALKNSQIDMIAIGSRYATSNLKIVDRLGANAFYCITNKENAALVDEIDDVLQQIMFDNPEFEGKLNEKFFGHASVSQTPLYTKQELAYIESLDPVKIKIYINQHPSCYEEDGEIKGIWVEYIKLLSEKTGIDFIVENGEGTDISEEHYDALLNRDYLVFRTQRSREYNNRTEENLTTIPLMDIKLSYFVRKDTYVDSDDTGNIVAVTKDLAFVEKLLQEQNEDYEVIYYDTAKECFEALVDEKVDMIIQNTFWASYLMQKPEYADKLTEIPGTDYDNQAVLVADEDKEMLITIINKAINHISEEEIDAIVTRELLQNPYQMDNDDFLYQYWKWVLIVFAVIAIALAVYTVLTHKMANMKVQRKEYELLQKKIQLDEVTGLYNRTYFFELVKEWMDETNEDLCIITMDIANFKVVNEIYGMNVGDELLKEVAEHVRNIGKEHKVIAARFMADHYYMCMTKEDFEAVHFPKSFKTFLEDIDIKVIYGVFVAEDGNKMPVNVMCDRAFVAAHDRNYTYTEYIHFYNDAERKQIMVEQEIENEMEKAMENHDFYIVVQPKYNSVSERIVGGEALVRWQHPEKGIISPGIFIPVFEKNGFIIQLDYYVWEETCRLLEKMKENGIKTVPVSVNVSRAHFYGSELIPKLKELIEKYHLEASDIELEITESICGEDPETIYDKIRELQNLGFKIAMDDFGSGYSSLNMLKEMPLDILKMDLKFLDGDQEKGQKILKALIDMAHTLDLKVVVEGVEILSQVEFLRQFEACSIQGYYYSRPLVGDVFEEVVSKEE